MSDFNESDFDQDDDRRLGDLYRRAADDQPPAELDQRILAAAAAAGQRRRSRWLPGRGPLAGLATAAVVVLAVTLLLRQTEPPLPAEASGRERAAPAASPLRQEARVAEPAANAPAVRPAAGPAAAADEAEARPERKAALADSRSNDTGRTAAAPPRREIPASASQAPAQAEEIETVEALADGSAAPGLSGGALVRRAAAFAAPDCAETFPLPDGATLRIHDGGLEVSVNGERWALRCVDGVWQREAEPVLTESSRPQSSR
ncbi:MAG: hypothetical protein RIC56_12880 [Pseudomonadales bacterium]